MVRLSSRRKSYQFVQRLIFCGPRYTHSSNSLYKIGPKENNAVVEANGKNSSFMKAWEECKFILETLFERNHRGDASESVAAIKPAGKQKTNEPKIDSGSVKPPVTNFVRKVTRSSKKINENDANPLPEHYSTVIHLPIRSVQSKITRAKAKMNSAVIESSPVRQPPVRSVQLKEAAASTDRKETRAMAKLNMAANAFSPERQSTKTIVQPVCSVQSKNAVANIQRRVTRATAKLNLVESESSAVRLPPVRSVQLKESVAWTDRQEERATTKLNLAANKLPERQLTAKIVQPVCSVQSKNAVANIQRKVTRVTPKLNLALLEPSQECQSKNVVLSDPLSLKSTKIETKSNALPIVQRKVTRAMAKADSAKASLAENCNFASTMKTKKRKAECDAISVLKKKKKP